MVTGFPLSLAKLALPVVAFAPFEVLEPYPTAPKPPAAAAIASACSLEFSGLLEPLEEVELGSNDLFTLSPLPSELLAIKASRCLVEFLSIPA